MIQVNSRAHGLHRLAAATLKDKYDAGLTDRQIGALVGIPWEIVRTMRRKAGYVGYRKAVWTAKEKARLVKLRADGETIEVCAGLLNKEVDMIRHQLKQGKSAPTLVKFNPDRKMRTCLHQTAAKCAGEFMSEGPGNRKCPACRKSSGGHDFFAESYRVGL